jgi:hypothetical protein
MRKQAAEQYATKKRQKEQQARHSSCSLFEMLRKRGPPNQGRGVRLAQAKMAVYDPRPFTELGPRWKIFAANALRCLLTLDASTEYRLREARTDASQCEHCLVPRICTGIS